MKPNAQRIAIAEFCGWKWFMCGNESIPNPLIVGWSTNDGAWYSALTDYLNDLNAIHEAEKRLEPDSYPKYLTQLQRLVSSENCFEVENRFFTVSATAAQRCEAFLKTIGKWEDDK